MHAFSEQLQRMKNIDLVFAVQLIGRYVQGKFEIKS